MLNRPRGPVGFALTDAERNAAGSDVMDPKHSLRTDSACEEIEKRDGTLGQANGFLSLFHRLRDEWLNSNVHPIASASHNLEVDHQSVQRVPKLVTRAPRDLPENRKPICLTLVTGVSHSDPRHQEPLQPSPFPRAAGDDAVRPA